MRVAASLGGGSPDGRRPTGVGGRVLLCLLLLLASFAAWGGGQATGHAATSPTRAPWFAGPRTSATPDFPVQVAIGDLSGDGAADVAATNSDWSVSVLLNRGNGR